MSQPYNAIPIEDWAENQEMKFYRKGFNYTMELNGSEVGEEVHGKFYPMLLSSAECEEIEAGNYWDFPELVKELEYQYSEAGEAAEMMGEE